MATELPPDYSHIKTTQQPDDQYLLSKMLAGDEAALRALINRYDKLVRYTIFQRAKKQCANDPQWLEMVASNSWMGFVQSVHRKPANPPQNLKAYLVQIARNQTLSALRSHKHTAQNSQIIEDDDPRIAAVLDSPGEMLSNIEDLESLQDCFAKLDPEQQKTISQLESITNRRWKEAADALGVQESTLRSRWAKILDLLRRCMAGKS